MMELKCGEVAGVIGVEANRRNYTIIRDTLCRWARRKKIIRYGSYGNLTYLLDEDRIEKLKKLLKISKQKISNPDKVIGEVEQISDEEATRRYKEHFKTTPAGRIVAGIRVGDTVAYDDKFCGSHITRNGKVTGLKDVLIGIDGVWRLVIEVNPRKVEA